MKSGTSSCTHCSFLNSGNCVQEHNKCPCATAENIWRLNSTRPLKYSGGKKLCEQWSMLPLYLKLYERSVRTKSTIPPGIHRWPLHISPKDRWSVRYKHCPKTSSLEAQQTMPRLLPLVEMWSARNYVIRHALSLILQNSRVPDPA